MSDSYSKIYNLARENNTLINVIIELSTKCNWNCKHCYLPSHDNNGLSKEVLFDLFSQLREIGCFDLSFTSGEIFYRKDIMDIIKKARSMSFNLTLLSNISLLNEEKIKQLSNLYISLISCTIFSLDEKIHDSITGIPGSLKRALNNVFLLKKYNIPLEIKTIIMKENYDSYKQLKDFCTKNDFQYKIDHDIFSKNNGDSSPKQLKMSTKQIQEVLLDLDKLKDFKAHKHLEDEPICPVVSHCCSIDCDGNISPCNKFFVSIGNIYQNTIDEIWNNNPKLDKLRSLKWGDLNECINCKNNEYCYRCPGVALLEDGHLLGRSSLACEFADARSILYLQNSN